MNWKIVELEVALITAIVLIAYCWQFERLDYIIYFFMTMMVVTPAICWIYNERMISLKRKENIAEYIRSQVDREYSAQVSAALKVIDELKMKNEDLEKECKQLRKEIEGMKI